MDSLATKDEQPRVTYLRRIIVAVTVLFVASIGLPLWFTTTTIYRAELPINEINSLTENLQNKLNFNIPVYLEYEGTAEEISSAQLALNGKLYDTYPELRNFWSLDLKSATGQDVDVSKDYLVKLNPSGEGSTTFSISPFGKDSTLQYAPGTLDQYLPHLLVDELFKQEIESFTSIIRNEKNKEETVALPYSANYNIVFSLFTESGHPIDWEIGKVSKLFQPVFQQLNHYTNFSISSQVQYYSKLTQAPQLDAEGKKYEIKQDELNTFINFGDWNLISHETNPTINFIIYFSESNYNSIPLKIENSQQNSFLVPQWGGVYIFNKDRPVLSGHGPTHITESDLVPIMETFVSQLFQLIGMPLKPKSPIIRIDSLSRISTFKNLKQSLENLMSLIKLTELLNEISIPELTKESVMTTLDNIEQAIERVSSEKDFKNSVEYSARSVEFSDKAFFEKEMVQQAYFPQEHKLAVFLPLLGPICSILFLGSLKTFSEIKSDKKKKKE